MTERFVDSAPPSAPYASAIQGTYEQLRTHLVTGVLAPNEKLLIKNLCERYEVGPSAVREALARLSAEGLVVAEPQRGFHAAPVSIEELRDLTEVRIELETRCLRRSIENGDMAWETRVVGSLHQLSRMPRGEREGNPALPARPWEDSHAAFHTALVSACGSPWLLSLRQQLYVQSERYRLLAAARITRSRNLELEHKTLVKAVLDRDVDRAVSLVTTHFAATSENMTRIGAEAFSPPKGLTRGLST